jgi:hypothetical protein
MSKNVAIGVIAATALVGTGAAIAATQLGSDADEQAILDDAAGRLGVQPAELSQALQDAYGARIDQAVTDGQLDETQADELRQRIESGDLPLLDLDGRGGPGFHDGFGPGGHVGPFGGLEAAATFLGLTEEELRTELESGKTLAEIATANGKTADGLVDALVADAQERLTAAVADGRLTEDQKQQILDGLPAKVEALVNEGFDGFGDGPGFGHGHGPGFAAMGLDAAATFLGLTEEELHAELESGKTLAEIATANGKTADGLVQALLADAQAQLAAAVADGRLTEEQKQQILDRLEPRLTDLVNGSLAFGGRGEFGGRDGFGPPDGMLEPAA